MRTRKPPLFGNLAERHAILIAWVVVGVSFYLLPVILVTFKNLGMSSGSVSPWLPEGTEERAVFNEFADRFNNHDSLLVSWEGADQEDARFVTLTKEIVKADRTRAFQTSEEPLVGNIVSLTTFIDSFDEKYSADPEFREKVSKAMTGYLTSKQRTTGLLIIECTEYGANHRVMIYEMVDRIVREHLPVGVEPRYAGPCFLSICANQETSKVLRFVTPFSSLISLLVACFFLRNIVLSLLAFGISGLAAALSISAIHFGGNTMGNMLSMVPSLAQLLAMSNVIHLVNYYMESLHKHNDKERAWRDAVSNGWMPTVAAAITTVVGFASLLTSNIEVVRSFALFGTIAVLISMLIVLTSTPAVLILLKPDYRPGISFQASIVDWLVRITSKRKWSIAFLLISIFGIAGFGLEKLNSDVRMGTFFSKDSRYRINKSWFETKMGSIMGSELALSFDDSVEIETQFDIIEKIAGKVQVLDNEYSVFSPSVFRDLMEDEPVGKVWEKVKQSSMGVKEDGKYFWRIAIHHPLEPDPSESVFQSRMNRLIADIKSDPEIESLNRPKINLTGAFQLFANSQDGLVNQLLRSFLCAFLIITPIIMLFLRSVSLGFVAILGNLFPLVVFFGILGWIGFRIDIATMMTAAIAFGIAVDDTVHFLTWLARGMRRHEDLNHAIKYAFDNCAVAILQTTLIISLGMTAFVLSDFQPSLRFAIFSAVVLMIALVGDLILLPASILGIFRRVFQKRTGAPEEVENRSTTFEEKLESA